MRKLTPDEIAKVEAIAYTAIDASLSGGDVSSLGEDGGFIIANLIQHIRLIEQELECYRTKYEPPFAAQRPTLPRYMEKVTRRPALSTDSED